MPNTSRKVRSVVVEFGDQSAVLTIIVKSRWYYAMWKCTCGAIEDQVMKSTSIEDAMQQGRMSYAYHCAIMHAW